MAKSLMMLVNPAAGRSMSDLNLGTAVSTFALNGYCPTVFYTTAPGTASKIVEENAANYERLVCLGGDGTLSEVATALADRDEPADGLPALGLVPLGTANDFANAAQVPLEPLPALEMIASASSASIDLLKLIAEDGRTHWCANLASGGFGTQVTVETDEGLKKMLGGLAYLITGISKLGRIEPLQARLRGPEF